MCFPHGLPRAETQAVLFVPPSCILFRGEQKVYVSGSGSLLRLFV